AAPVAAGRQPAVVGVRPGHLAPRLRPPLGRASAAAAPADALLGLGQPAVLGRGAGPPPAPLPAAAAGTRRAGRVRLGRLAARAPLLAATAPAPRRRPRWAPGLLAGGQTGIRPCAHPPTRPAPLPAGRRRVPGRSCPGGPDALPVPAQGRRRTVLLRPAG